MTTSTSELVNKARNYPHILRDDALSSIGVPA